jgi:hypothetical protein
MPTTTIDPAKLSSTVQAIECLARSTPWASAKVDQLGTEAHPVILVQLDMPSTQPMEVRAELSFGGKWQVTSSGWSWKNNSVSDLRATAQVVQLAAAIFTLLDSIA